MDGPHHPPTHPPTHPHQPRLNETGMELMLNGSPGLLPAGEWVPIAPLIGQSTLTSSRPEGSGASGQQRMAPGARPQAPGLNSDSSPFLNLMGWAGSAMLDPCVCVCVCVFSSSFSDAGRMKAGKIGIAAVSSMSSWVTNDRGHRRLITG